eukprot:TRINITY_DN3869_c0_g1_i5.p2 TRINITY_DN3869_c0_g1~~TRINITY_DN3869_c0_g1_i5.p2  ORF type:complete len:104 (-),score=15.75 TRINITY_DN3869_c0_g1_i5:219-530(-)
MQAWSCATILLGMQSFMLEDSPSVSRWCLALSGSSGAGCISRTEETRKDFAARSIGFNQANAVYRRAFEAEAMAEMIEEATRDLDESVLPFEPVLSVRRSVIV